MPKKRKINENLASRPAWRVHHTIIEEDCRTFDSKKSYDKHKVETNKFLIQHQELSVRAHLMAGSWYWGSSGRASSWWWPSSRISECFGNTGRNPTSWIRLAYGSLWQPCVGAANENKKTKRKSFKPTFITLLCTWSVSCQISDKSCGGGCRFGNTRRAVWPQKGSKLCRSAFCCYIMYDEGYRNAGW